MLWEGLLDLQNPLWIGLDCSFKQVKPLANGCYSRHPVTDIKEVGKGRRGEGGEGRGGGRGWNHTKYLAQYISSGTHCGAREAEEVLHNQRNGEEEEDEEWVEEVTSADVAGLSQFTCLLLEPAPAFRAVYSLPISIESHGV